MTKAPSKAKSNTARLIVLVTVALVAAVLWLNSPPTTSTEPEVKQYWFYDLATRSLFKADTNAIPPIESPSGKRDENGEPVGVRAIVFGCDNCKESFIGYLKTYRPEGKQLLLSGQPNASRAAAEFEVIAQHNHLRWVALNSPEGIEIQRKARGYCPSGTRRIPCNP